MSKILEKRNQKIQTAVEKKDWDEVLHLLDQSFENSIRKDRVYKTFSVNIPVSKDGQYTEYIDSIRDYSLNPLEKILKKEEQTQLINTLLSLTNTELKMIIDRYLENKSFAQIARDTGISDKTVKKRLNLVTKNLKNKLQ